MPIFQIRNDEPAASLPARRREAGAAGSAREGRFRDPRRPTPPAGPAGTGLRGLEVCGGGGAGRAAPDAPDAPASRKSPRSPLTSGRTLVPPAPLTSGKPPVLARTPSPRGAPAADSGQSTRRAGSAPRGAAATSSWAGGGASGRRGPGAGTRGGDPGRDPGRRLRASRARPALGERVCRYAPGPGTSGPEAPRTHRPRPPLHLLDRETEARDEDRGSEKLLKVTQLGRIVT
nr:circumsporozoite protein-like [Dasypus novemcinctus]